MSETVALVSVSDDRYGRKGGVYGITQNKVRTDGYQLDVIKRLCSSNGDILSCRVSWQAHDGVFANHTHENFTSERCMRYMEMERYLHCLQHASGMMVFRKSVRSVEYVDRWMI